MLFLARIAVVFVVLPFFPADRASARLEFGLFAIFAASKPRQIGYRTEHSFSIVLIEVMIKATEAGPVLAEELELILSEGDSFPVASTCCPR
jgi:hypothetical protein